MPYLPPRRPDLECPACGSRVAVIAKRRGWTEELEHELPETDACKRALRDMEMQA
jgi:DNA-directed RNA polymerase subunit RPC12/RpoP